MNLFLFLFELVFICAAILNEVLPPEVSFGINIPLCHLAFILLYLSLEDRK